MSEFISSFSKISFSKVKYKYINLEDRRRYTGAKKKFFQTEAETLEDKLTSYKILDRTDPNIS